MSDQQETIREHTSFSTEWRPNGTIWRHCNCTLGKLFQEQAGLVLEHGRQKYAHLLIKDCCRWGWWPPLVAFDHCGLSSLLLKTNFITDLVLNTWIKRKFVAYKDFAWVFNSVQIAYKDFPSIDFSFLILFLNIINCWNFENFK